VQLINNHLDWKWTGVLHEAVDSPQAITSGVLPNVYNLVSSDGSRSQDPQKYQKDAQILEKALQQEPNNRRYQFYLAQSYRDAGEHGLAMQNYLKKIAMGGWDQEIFCSILQVALMQEQLQMPPEIIAASLLPTVDEARPP
jgi:tetratricopeptide (TPR) repeat protein